MTNIIHCEGHEFSVNMRSVPFRGETIQMQDGWNCNHCGLHVKTTKAAQYLTGKTS